MDGKKDLWWQVHNVCDAATDLAKALGSLAHNCKQVAAAYTDGCEECTHGWIEHIGKFEKHLRDITTEVDDATHIAQLMYLVFISQAAKNMKQ